MAWFALALALVAIAAAVLDVRLAVAGLGLAAMLAVAAIVRGHWVRVGAVALVLILAGALLTGWEIRELRRPPTNTAPDVPRYQRPGQDREVLLPLTVAIADVQRLALLEMAPGSDPVYEGFEPQFIDRGHERGYRIIAYRNDGYVDYYDDLALSAEPDEASRVTGKGRLNYSRQDLGAPVIERDEQGRAAIRFSFTDVEGRAIRADLRERTTKRSVPLNLLAPVGLSAVDPEYFPLFLLNDFEFFRVGGADLDLTIDNRSMPLQDFPVPLPVQGQRRNFVKYTMDSEIITVFPTSAPTAQRVRTSGDSHQDGEVTYLFDGEALERIFVRGTEIVFDPALDLSASGTGRLTMSSHPDRGLVGGPYEVSSDGTTARITLAIDQVQVPRQRGLLYRLIVNDSSMFGTWPKAYSYAATIHRDSGAIDARWINAKPGGG
ncbi:MAG: hypothetical protein Q4F67_06985 [Propionibacteriaceae bacterium]|nr:hypothetical protein [Propionibacteriaceae bacterium]